MIILLPNSILLAIAASPESLHILTANSDKNAIPVIFINSIMKLVFISVLFTIDCIRAIIPSSLSITKVKINTPVSKLIYTANSGLYCFNNIMIIRAIIAIPTIFIISIIQLPPLSAKSFVQTISVPETAALGKTRVRIRIDSSTPSSADASVSGRIYDFVVYVMGTSDRTDCFISVTSSNNDLGSALIETAPNESGRYEIGSRVTVKAVINETAETAIEFKGWQESGEIVSKEPVYTFTVTKSTSLIALFEAALPELATPEVSTAEDPIWYQIMNAHTADTRKERYIAYDTNLSSDYTTELRAEKPATQTDKFLWRLEDAGNGQVYIVNRGNNLSISGPKVLESENFTVSATGSKFAITPSGNSNGSYSIQYEGDNSYLLNAKDGLWSIVLYNAGIGTGSGWYFYKVTINPPSAIDEIDSYAAPQGRLYDGHLTITGLEAGSRVRVISLSGQLLADFQAADTTLDGDLRYAEKFIIAVVESASGKTISLKLLDSKL